MKYSFTAATFIALATAATHEVTVGPGLDFSPDTVTAASGDVVQFKFGAGHNVVSGAFDSPCQNNGKIFSGNPNDGDVFSVTLNDTNPVWIFCAVPGHCEGGMAMVINAPSDKTIDQYKSAAQSASGSTAPDSIMGGVFGAVDSSSGSGSSSSSESGSSPTASASGSDGSASASATSAESSGSSTASGATTSSTGNAAGNVLVNVGLVAGAAFGGLALVL